MLDYEDFDQGNDYDIFGDNTYAYYADDKESESEIKQPEWIKTICTSIDIMCNTPLMPKKYKIKRGEDEDLMCTSFFPLYQMHGSTLFKIVSLP